MEVGQKCWIVKYVLSQGVIEGTLMDYEQGRTYSHIVSYVDGDRVESSLFTEADVAFSKQQVGEKVAAIIDSLINHKQGELNQHIGKLQKLKEHYQIRGWL